MNEPATLDDPRAAVTLAHAVGQRRAIGAVAGRCSAAHAELLRRIHDERLYLAVAPSWHAYCGTYLAVSRRHADRLIALLRRFGPVYFELSQLAGLSVRDFLAIQPAIRDQSLVVDGAAISLIPENAPAVLEALGRLLQPKPRRRREPARETFHTRLANLTARGRDIANRLVALYSSAASAHDRDLVLEAATELRLILMQPGLE